MIKPFDGQRMNKIIDRFFRKNKEVKILEFPNGRKVSVNSIVYTSFSGHYVTVFMKDGENVQIRCTQKNFEKIIGPYPQLISSFKGVIVNLEQVDGIEEDRFRMKDGEFVINPSQEVWDNGDLQLTVASTKQKVIMLKQAQTLSLKQR